MSEEKENEEQEVKEDEEENAKINPQPGGSAAEQLPEDDREPGSDAEPVQADRSSTGESTLTPGESRLTGDP